MILQKSIPLGFRMPFNPIIGVTLRQQYILLFITNRMELWSTRACHVSVMCFNRMCMQFTHLRKQSFLMLGKRIYHKYTGIKLVICNLQFGNRFGSLRISFCIFSKNCELLKADMSWVFRVIHWTSYIVSYFKSSKYSVLNNNLASQRFMVRINFKLIRTFFSREVYLLFW